MGSLCFGRKGVEDYEEDENERYKSNLIQFDYIYLFKNQNKKLQ